MGKPAIAIGTRQEQQRASAPGTARPLLARIFRSRFSGVLVLLAVLAAWDLSARLKIIDLISWPPFLDVADRFLWLVTSGQILEHLKPSLQRVLTAYAASTAVAVTLGLLIGFSQRAYNLLEPTLEALRPISVIALIPVIILFLGLEDRMKIFIIAYACFFPILLNTISGVRSVDPVLIDTSRTFGLSRARTVWFVMVPAATPYIFTGMRISVGFALMAMVAAEMLTGGDGIGAFILDSQRTFKVKDMYAGIVTLGILGYAANRGFVAIERRLLRWHAGYGGNNAT